LFGKTALAIMNKGDVMMEWPGRCNRCKEIILDWAEAGLYGGHWVHKSCYSKDWAEARAKGIELAGLRDPTVRSSQLEWPMLGFLLLFHFGLGFAVIGWLMISQFNDSAGNPILIAGLITPLIGVIGIALNIVSRRRIELIRQALDLQGGWKPGR
jgi:hypothetical protein